MIVFSGGMSAFELPTINKLSPDGTAFTFPLSHPVAAAVDAISTANGLQRKWLSKSWDANTEGYTDLHIRVSLAS